MVVLMLFALVWVTVRVVVALRLALSGDDRAAPRAPSPQDRPTPQDAVERPQDALSSSGPAAHTGGTEVDWSARFRAAVLDEVARPGGGPAHFGGRDDTAYLFGWDAAVDWIGQGQDAKAPVWGDLAYMTGWYDGVRDVATARRRTRRLADA
ncbi:MAG: hypothetical protein ABJA89_12235 [Lapillicoccus sp.]